MHLELLHNFLTVTKPQPALVCVGADAQALEQKHMELLPDSPLAAK